MNHDADRTTAAPRIITMLITFVVGVGTGGLVVTGLVMFGQFLSDPEAFDPPEFSEDSAAYLDSAPCPDENGSAMEGTWRGVPVEVDGEQQEWQVHRDADGKFETRFRFTGDGGQVDEQVERGIWAYSDCLYSTITTWADGDPVLYVANYRVHSVYPDTIRYTSYRTGRSFVVERVGDSHQ